MKSVDASANQIRRLKPDFAKVTKDRDTLKKATAYLARESPALAGPNIRCRAEGKVCVSGGEQAGVCGHGPCAGFWLRQRRMAAINSGAVVCQQMSEMAVTGQGDWPKWKFRLGWLRSAFNHPGTPQTTPSRSSWKKYSFNEGPKSKGFKSHPNPHPQVLTKS